MNSYKRYVDGSWAPTRIAWSDDNRTAGVRVVGDGPSLRLECRIPGADCNPYLALAALLAAGLDGVAQGTEPPPRFDGDVYAAARPAARAPHAAPRPPTPSSPARSPSRRSVSRWSTTTPTSSAPSRTRTWPPSPTGSGAATSRGSEPAHVRTTPTARGQGGAHHRRGQRHRTRRVAAVRGRGRVRRRGRPRRGRRRRDRGPDPRRGGARPRRGRRRRRRRRGRARRLRGDGGGGRGRVRAARRALQQRRRDAGERRRRPHHRRGRPGTPRWTSTPRACSSGASTGSRRCAAPVAASIVNTASFVAIMGAATPQVAYTASKGAVLAFTPRAGGDPRPRGHPGQRPVPGAPAHRAADEVPRHRREAAAPPRAHPDGPLRRGDRDRQGRAVPRLRRVVVHDRRRRSWSTAASPPPTSRPSDAIRSASSAPSVPSTARSSPSEFSPARPRSTPAWAAPPSPSGPGGGRLWPSGWPSSSACVPWMVERADEHRRRADPTDGPAHRPRPDRDQPGVRRAGRAHGWRSRRTGPWPTPRSTIPRRHTGFRRFIRRDPLGVVLVVAPWNYPYLSLGQRRRAGAAGRQRGRAEGVSRRRRWSPSATPRRSPPPVCPTACSSSSTPTTTAWRA